MNHPIFGKLTLSKSKDARESKGRYSFGIEANNRDKNREQSTLKLINVQCVVATIFSHDVIVFRRNQLKDVSSLLEQADCASIVCYMATW